MLTSGRGNLDRPQFYVREAYCLCVTGSAVMLRGGASVTPLWTMAIELLTAQSRLWWFVPSDPNPDLKWTIIASYCLEDLIAEMFWFHSGTYATMV
jgi:hypothetical protein